MSKPTRKITGPVRLNCYGQVFAFDNQEQVPELQRLSWPMMFAKEATELGFDVHGMIVDTAYGKIRLIATEEGDFPGFGWEVVK